MTHSDGNRSTTEGSGGIASRRPIIIYDDCSQYEDIILRGQVTRLNAAERFDL